MYILEVNHGGGEIHRHFLLPGQTYTLGRKECRILLPAAEPSISRHHATVVVSPMPRYSVLDPAAQLEIRIEDVSKHGTFVDRERVGKDNTRFLYPEDRIRLGLRITARIIPMVLVLGISPDLTDEHLDLVLDAATRIGALVVEDVMPAPLQYYERHTNCVGFLYVAEDGFAMEETMMEALGYGYTLVTANYIAHLVKSLEETDTLMPNEFPTPSSPPPASLALRAVHYRRPAQTYFSVTEFLSIGRPIVATVFKEYTFMVLEKGIQAAYETVLKLFGGTTEVLDLSAVPAWSSTQPQSVGPYPLTRVVLVAETDFRTVSDAAMEQRNQKGELSVKHSRPLITAYLTLYKVGVCLIPEENVHLALYRNDAKELNTKVTACYLQRTSDALAADQVAEVATAAADKTARAAAEEKPKTDATVPPLLIKNHGSKPRTSSVGRQDSTGAVPGESELPRSTPAATATTTADATAQPAVASPVSTRRRSRESSLVGLGDAPDQSDNLCKTTTAAAPSTAPAVSPINASTSLSSVITSPPAATIVNPRAGTRGASLPSNGITTTAAGAGGESGPAHTLTSLSPRVSVRSPRKSASPAPASTEGAGLAAPAVRGVEHASKSPSNGPSFTPFPHTRGCSNTQAEDEKSNGATSNPAASPAAPVAAKTTDAEAAPVTAEPSITATANSIISPRPEGSGDTFRETSESSPVTPVLPQQPQSQQPAQHSARSRLVGPRASHPFSLSSLRPRTQQAAGGSGEGDDDGAADTDGPSHSTEAAAEEEEVAQTAATAPTSGSSNALGRRTSVPPPPRRGTSFGTGSALRRPSLSNPPSTSTASLPLKSEEVIRTRSRAGSNSQPPAQIAHPVMTAAATAGSSGFSLGGLDEHRAGTPSEELSRASPHDDVRRPSVQSVETANDTNGATVSRTASATSSGLLQPSRAVLPTSKGAAVAASSAAPLSVRRGEQRLAATAAAPAAARRSAVRVHGASDRPATTLSTAPERSVSPQQAQSLARAKRYTTPERDVVVHGAAQLAKTSPPRQRVEAVRIASHNTAATATADRRMSLSHEAMPSSVSRHADPEEEQGSGGSMGNRRSVVRRDSFTSQTRPVLASKRASSSFQRTNSSQLREMPTPHRLTTPRVSNSVPRNRKAKAYGGAQHHRSPLPSAEDSGVLDTETDVSIGAGSLSSAPLASPRTSIRRQRGSPTHTSAATTSNVPQGPALPGQIPGLRGGSAASVAGSTSGNPAASASASAEAHHRLNDVLGSHCQHFMVDFIDAFMTETERITQAVVRQTYMDSSSKETLENGLQRILEFLQYISSTEADIPSMYSTANTRAACHQVRQKSQYTLSKIKTCYKSVNCKIPSSLTRARTALSGRNVSPPQRRANPAGTAVSTESGSVRRYSAF